MRSYVKLLVQCLGADGKASRAIGHHQKDIEDV